MKKSLVSTLLLSFVCCATFGCSGAGPRKYVLFGEPQPEKVEMFEDYWQDYPFRPDDPKLPLRRGKGGVIRFFKKGSYTKSILVDGELTVNVYYDQRDGVTLTEPDEQMVLSSKELNEHRKFDKEVGYSYHIFLDLGVYDQPEAEITILSVFKDAKTGQATLSKEIRTTTLGTSPPVKKVKDKPETDAEKIARRILGSDEEIENPIAELQARYSIRNKNHNDELEKTGNTRLRQTVDVSDTEFEDLTSRNSNKSVSYLEEIQKNRDAALQKLIEENQAKEERYRANRSRQTEDYRNQKASGDEGLSSLREAPGLAYPANFNNVTKSYVDMQQAISSNYERQANQFSERAKEEYAKGTVDSSRETQRRSTEEATAVENAKQRYIDESTNQDEVLGSPLTHGYELPKPARTSNKILETPSEQDLLNDFAPDSSAPQTEVYVKKMQ